MNTTPISENDIQAYIDGRLNAERRADVESYLAKRPELRAEIEKDIAIDRSVREAFGAMDLGPVPADISAPTTGFLFAPALRNIAAAALLIAIGGAGGYWAGTKSVESVAPVPASIPWVTLATTAHRTFSVEVVHPVEVRADNAQHLAKWLGKRLDFNLVIPDMTSAGFKLMGGRLLNNDNGPVGQLMYEDEAGGRITLYLCRSTGAETSFRFADHDGVSAFYWIEDGIAMALVGNQPRETLQSLATIAYKSF